MSYGSFGIQSFPPLPQGEKSQNPPFIKGMNINTINFNFYSQFGTNYHSIGPLTHTAGIVTIDRGSVWRID
jgi:hypothetical protein